MPKYTQRKDGRWSTRIWDGSYKDGQKVYTTLYSSKSSKDLEKKVIEFEAKRLTGGVVVRSDIDIYTYALRWINTSKSLREHNTKVMYENIVKVHLKDFKGFDWDAFNVSNIQAIINERADKPRTCQQIRVALVQIGRNAEYDKLLKRGTTDEIFEKIIIPKYKSPEKHPLTDADKDALINANFTPKERAFVFTLYYCGLRREEALALLKSDISNVITINKAVIFDNNNPVVKGTKSERGMRTVPAPIMLQEILKEYVVNLNQGDYLFTQSNGMPMTKSSYRRFWESIQKKFAAAGGNPDITAHIFRHNYCTMLCYTSVTEHSITTKKIAELLGDTEKMVLDVYSHIVQNLEKTEKSIESALKL